MKYDDPVLPGVFIQRNNRFVAEIEIDGQRSFAHVPNTGRCKELFVPGARTLVYRSNNPKRKYAYTLWAVYKKDVLVHIDSAGANRLAEEALKAGKIRGLEDITEVQREKSFSHSRFDFCFRKGEQLCYMEIKGVTLENDGVAMFPDAPTERGARHLEELIKAKEMGYGAYVMFVVQMKGVKYFTPFVERDPAFAENLLRAEAAGVTVLAYDATVTLNEILLDQEVPVILKIDEEKR